MPNVSQFVGGKRSLTAQEADLPYAEYYYRRPADPDPRAVSALHHGPIHPAAALPYEHIDELLQPGYHEVETGRCVLPNGVGYLAVHQALPGCTAQMLQWWFAWHAAGPGLRYAIWYPPDHITIAVSDEHWAKLHDPEVPLVEKSRDVAHFVVEGAGTGVSDTIVSYVAPDQLGFDMDRFRTVGGVTGGVAVFGGNMIGELRSGPPGKSSTIMLHCCREIDGGIELRSRYWLGCRLNRGEATCVLPAGVRVPDAVPLGLGLRHLMAYSNLAALLPELYQRFGPGM